MPLVSEQELRDALDASFRDWFGPTAWDDFDKPKTLRDLALRRLTRLLQEKSLLDVT